mgnify:CR=1 FL=1
MNYWLKGATLVFLLTVSACSGVELVQAPEYVYPKHWQVPTDFTQLNSVVENERALVVFSSSWSYPCSLVRNRLEEQEPSGEYTLVYVDTAKWTEMEMLRLRQKSYNLSGGIPCALFMDKNRIIKTWPLLTRVQVPDIIEYLQH